MVHPVASSLESRTRLGKLGGGLDKVCPQIGVRLGREKITPVPYRCGATRSLTLAILEEARPKGASPRDVSMSSSHSSLSSANAATPGKLESGFSAPPVHDQFLVQSWILQWCHTIHHSDDNPPRRKSRWRRGAKKTNEYLFSFAIENAEASFPGRVGPFLWQGVEISMQVR